MGRIEHGGGKGGVRVMKSVLAQFPVVYELSPEDAIEAHQTGEVAIRRRRKWIGKLPEDFCLRSLILSCLRDDPRERPSAEILNIRMKILRGLGLEEFEIKEVLGIEDDKRYGSFGAVCEVICRGAPRIAKRLSKILNMSKNVNSQRQSIRKKFHKECLTLSQLDHPNIVKFVGVHFSSSDHSDMSIIMERLFTDLEKFLDPYESPDIHLNTKLSILLDVSAGLIYLHTRLKTPYVHGELIAANVLLTEDLRQAKIADLGVSKLLEETVGVESHGIALSYLPPEAFSKHPKYSTPLDIFSFGHLTLYVSLQEFPDLTVSRKKQAVNCKMWIDQLSSDHCLRELILSCLKDKPEKRPSAIEVNSILNALYSKVGGNKNNQYGAQMRNQFAELCRLCRSGQLLKLKEALYYNKEVLNYSSTKGNTLLHEAVDADQPDIVQLLLLHGLNPNIQTKQGLTPLHLAVSKGLVDCATALLENGADITIKDGSGQNAITKAELRGKRQRAFLKLLRSKEIVLLASKGDLKELEERLRNVPWPETVVMEEAMLTAISKGNDDCIPLLVEAGVRRLDCALHLAIQLERIKTLALLLLCKAAIAGDANTIHTLLFEPFVALNAPWYMAKVHKILSQHDIELKLPITVSVSEKNYDATKELLLRTEVDMGRKKVDWGDLKLTLLDSSWIRSIAPWVVSLTLDNNDLRTLPHEMFTLTQLRRLDLSQNILEDVPANLLALPNLEYLSLGHNRLKDLPETTHWSASLLSLDLSDNLLTTLPQGIQHSNIEILNLSNNQFRVVPKFLCRVRTLTSLDLTSMQISVLPKEIENLNRLVHLNVSNHVNHVDLPSEQQSGIKGKLRVQTRITKPCNHVKLILLCHSDMAKTVMLSRLKPQLNLPPNQPLPEIDTFQWAFKPLFTRKMFASPKLYFNTWLIGTHYSCRSIYPCFFTTSALYVIVWDLAITADLSEQIKPYVDLLVRYVPAANVLVIAVLPEECKGSKNQQTTETLASRLNNFFSRPSYKSLRLHSVVLMVIDNPMLKEGQAELKQSLYSVAQQMITNGQKFVDRHVSETFFSLIPVLERERQTFTSQNKPGVLEEGTLWTLFDQGLSFDPPDRMELQSMVEFLREAGFLLHFEDPNDRLDQYYFTRPNWLFNTLLYIVRRTHAMEHRSCLFMSHQELCSSLADVSCSQDISKLLIRLMIRYSMAIPTKEDQYLLTFLLPHSSPSSDVLYCGTLRRQFAPQQQNFSIDLPVDLWSKLLCSIVSNLHQITNESELKTDNEIDKYTMSSSDIFAFTSSNGDEYDSKTNSHQAEIAFREGKERKETSTPVQSASLTKLHSELLNLDCTQRDISQLQLASSCNSHCNNSPENIANEGSKVTPVNLKGQLPQSEAIMLDVKAENTMTEEPEKSEQLIDGQGECKVGTSMLSTASIHKVSPVHFTEKSKKDRIKRSLSVKPISIEEGVEIWDCGIVYNKKGVKFSVFPCISNMLTVEKRGIEICCTRDSCGYVIMARLCWLVQQNLEEQYPHLLSTDTPLQNHELTQVVICPTCLEMGEQNPSCFLIEVCVRALRQRNEYNCINHRETIPFRDLTPDYLLLNFPSDLHLTNNMFDYNEAKPFHKGKHTILHDGRFEQQKVAVKMFYQIGSSSVTFPLSCIRKETDMLISLKHPNIVKMFGFCLDPICVLEEKAPLGNLLQMLLDTDRHRISRTVCFHISCQIASALSYLHRRDIVYRTLKASSVLLWSLDFNCDPSVKLASFERAAYQSPRGLMGKTTFSSYPAPEMLRYSFKEEYTEKVDIYSFGILLYELIKRQQCCGGTQSDNHIHSHKPNLSGVVATSYNTIVKLIEMCLLEDFLARPSADDLLQQLSEPLFQCYIASQVLRDCVSVRGYCFVPSVRQIWILCECMSSSERDENEGTEVFILDTVNLTVQGSLDFKERPTAMSTVDNKVWIGMADLCVHVYDTTTFRFTDRFYLDDLATVIADNDFYVFVGQVNGQLKCYPKLDLHRRDSKAISVTIGAKAIMAIVTVGDSIWLGCGNELVVMTAEEELLIRHRAKVCKPTDQVYRLTVSCHTNTVWCLVKKSHSISGWNTLTFQQKHTVDLREQLNHIFSELQLNYDPSIMYVVSLECVNDTIWVGLSCGVIMILTDNEQPKEIIHFKAHIGPTKCLMKIPHSSELHQHHAQSLLLSGGLGADSSLSDTTLERNRVVMLWHALSSSEFDTVVKRHNKYRCN